MKDDTEKILIFESLIDYQKDSVVSKTLIDKETGTVTLFAFDKGQALSEHTTAFDALVNVIDGKVEIKISDKIYKLSKNESIIMPSHKPHALKAISRFKMLLTMIR